MCKVGQVIHCFLCIAWRAKEKGKGRERKKKIGKLLLWQRILLTFIGVSLIHFCELKENILTFNRLLSLLTSCYIVVFSCVVTWSDITYLLTNLLRLFILSFCWRAFFESFFICHRKSMKQLNAQQKNLVHTLGHFSIIKDKWENLNFYIVGRIQKLLRKKIRNFITYSGADSDCDNFFGFVLTQISQTF